MSIATRTAETTWTGSLAAGDGSIHPDSGAFADLPVTWASRTEEPGGKTSPEELCAAAHSSCFAMALALKLLGRGQVPAPGASGHRRCHSRRASTPTPSTPPSPTSTRSPAWFTYV